MESCPHLDSIFNLSPLVIVSRGVAMGEGTGGHMPPQILVVPPPPQNHAYMFKYVNIARVLILWTPTKLMLMYS